MNPFQSFQKHLSRLFGRDESNPPAPAPEPVKRAFSEAELAEPVATLLTWLHGGSSPQVTARSEEPVAALERRYGIRIPGDFRCYLLGRALSEEVTDGELTAWWALDRVRNIPEEYGGRIDNPVIAVEADAYLFFADYLIWCWAWAVCCSEGPSRGKIAFIGGPDGFVANSFSEFAERYLRDPAGMANTMPSTARGGS